MGAFEYTALDSEGKEQTGVMEGDASRQIRQKLRDKGWSPLEVKEVRKASSTRKSISLFKPRVSVAEIALLTRQLATLIRAGLPVEETLRAVAQQQEKARVKNMIMAIRSRVLEGHTLADGLNDYSNVFSEMYRATVAAGEQSGHLDVVLERLADYTESRQEMGQKMVVALIYPVILTIVALGAVMFLLAFVVPKVVNVFDDIGQELPTLTVVMINISDFVREYGLVLLVLLVILVTAFQLLMRKEVFRRNVHRMLLLAPFISGVVRGINTAQFSRTLGTLMESGVPVLDSMQIASQVMSNLIMRESVMTAARKVREGVTLKNALDADGYFPPMMLHLIGSGESSGKLDEMLHRAADTQDRELETMRATLLGMFEPLLILVMGGLVLMIVLAVLLPIFDLNTLVQ